MLKSPITYFLFKKKNDLSIYIIIFMILPVKLI